MEFKTSDLRPDYDLAAIEKLLFIRTDLSDLTDAERLQLLAKVNTVGLKNTRLDNVQIILTVMHDARGTHEHRFINEVFIPWIGLRNKTRPHLDRVIQELQRIGEFEAGSEQEAAHCVNIYRSLVADLFDPYMTLLVACFQFTEGKFVSISDADLGNGERTKAEYLAKRVKAVFSGETFLSGYNPLVRNAASHPGSSGVNYLKGKVVFKNIKREVPLKVETVEWTIEELQLRIIQLLEAVASIEVAVEVFGLDCSAVVSKDFITQLNLVYHALSREETAELRSRREAFATQIRNAPQLNDQEKRAVLSQILFVNCEMRDMPCHGARFSDADSLLCVDVPLVPIDKNDDQEVVLRLMELCRYAILARTIFGELYPFVCVVETDIDRTTQRLSGTLSGVSLDAWIAEKEGLVDLVNDATWTLEGKPLEVNVDFQELQKKEHASPDMPFPRRDRGTT